MATNLLDIDLDEEIRRQKAISSLLAQQPEAQPQSEADQQPEEQPKEVKPPATVTDAYGDWRKWPSISPEQAADIPTIDQPPAPAGHVDLAPPGHIDLAPPQQASTVPVPTPPEGIQTDPETGTRYVTDEGTGTKVPYAEPATAADKEAFKPGDVTLPKVTTEGTAEVQPAPDKLDQVERATLVKLPTPPAPVKPAPGTLTQVEKALPVFPTGPRAPGAHTQLAPPGQMDLRPDEIPAAPASTQPATASTAAAQPPPAAKPAVQPVGDNWKTWTTIDGTPADPSFTPSPEGKPPTSVDTLKAGEGNRVDPGQLYSYLQNKFANSSLVGYVPPDGARWGINTGSAAEWAAFGLAVAKQESGFNTRSYNASDPGGSAGLFQFGQGQTQFTKGGDQFNPQESADAFVRSVEHYVANKGSVANMGETFGSIRRPNEAGQYISYAQEIADKMGAGGIPQAAAQPKKEDWESWSTLAPENEAAVTKAQQDQLKILDAVNQNTPNKGALWKILNTGVPGVSSGTMQAYKDQFKKQVTQYALDYYKPGNPNITPEDAFKMATGDADFGTLAGEVATKVVPNLTKAAIAMERSQDTIDENRINQFLNAINPNMPPEQRVEFKRSMMAMTPAERAQHINEGLAQMDPGAVAAFNPTDIADSFDRISDPVYQAKRKQALDAAVAKNQKDLATDPRLVNTPAEGVTQFLASAPKNVSEMLTPVIGQSAMLSEIYTDTSDQIRKEHPDWSDDDVKQKATASTVAQLGPQVLISAVTGGALSAATKGITQPLLELGARLGLHGTVAGVAGGIQQMLKNNVEGHPLMEGVQEAVVANSAFGVLGGALAGAPEVKPIGSPLETRKVHGPQEQVDVGFPHGPGEPEAQPPGVQQPVTVEQNVPDTSGTKWYHPEPIVTRGTERTTFTPSELAEQASALSGRTPEELQAAAEKLTPQTDFTQRQVFLDSAQMQQAEIEKAIQAQTQAVQAQQTRLESSHMAGALHKEGAVGTNGDVTGSTGRDEPWVSKIANRFTSERMVNGELGHVEPGIGVSKEEMLAAGLKMSPEQINQHVSDVMNNRGGDPKAQASAIRAEEARLSKRSNDASLLSEYDLKNQQARIDAENAFKDLTDFHNGPVAKLKNSWHAQGMSLQGEIPVDLSTYNGLRDAYLKNVGKAAPDAMEPALRETARRVRDASIAESQAIKRLGDRVEREAAQRMLPTEDQVRENIARRMKVEPCPV